VVRDIFPHITLVSDEGYDNTRSMLEWTCVCGEFFRQSWSNIYYWRFGCPVCDYHQEKLTIEIINKRMAVYKLKTVDLEYRGGYTKMKWFCELCGESFDRKYPAMQELPRCRICKQEA
jgi:hypothetical protein